MRCPRAATIAALFVGSLSVAPPCLAQVVSPRTIQTTAFNSGTMTTGGTAQSVPACTTLVTTNCWTLVQANGFSLPNVYRCVQNPSSATEDLFVALGATASLTIGQDLQAGSYWCAIWPGTWSIYAATTAHKYLLSEYQY